MATSNVGIIIKLKIINDEAAGVNIEDFCTADVFNADENSLFFTALPNKTNKKQEILIW